MSFSRRNILLFHLGALGDFLLTSPLALALSRIHPQSRIIYVTHAQKGALAERLLRIESADIEPGWHHLYADAGQLPPAALKLLSGAHSVYSFIADDNSTWSSNLRRHASGVDLCCLRPTPAEDWLSHYSDHLLAQLRTHPALHEAVRQMIQSINHRGLMSLSAQHTPRVIAIHPGSGSPGKCWAADSFLLLARRLGEEGNIVKVLAGEVELERWPAKQVDAFRAVGEVRTPATYVELMRELEGTDLYIGNDSGPTHLAGLMGLPTLALFGPTNPGLWRPLGPRVHVVHRALNDLSVDDVQRELAVVAGPQRKP